jgi:hypothetical protein
VQREDRHVLARAGDQARDGGDAVSAREIRREEYDRHD